MKKAILYSLLASVTLSACAIKPSEDTPPPMGMQPPHEMGQNHQMPMGSQGMHDMHGEDHPMNHHSGHNEMSEKHGEMHGSAGMNRHQEHDGHGAATSMHPHNHTYSMGSNSLKPNTMRAPTEPGQGAFATIAEIVRILEADPNTDWSKVDINRLREHLVDMSNLSLYAKATQARSNNSIVFTITGSGNTLRAIQNMVPVHTMVVSQARGWNAKTKALDNGIKLLITSSDEELLNKLEALGFFGFMALENHHQSHHLQMALGKEHFH